MQDQAVLGRQIQVAEQPQAAYRWLLALFSGFLALCLLAIVDIRRGFLFPEYLARAPYYAFSPWHVLMLGIGLGGLVAAYRGLRAHESRMAASTLASSARWLALLVFGLLVLDLLTYRGVAAGRAAAASQLSASWLRAFETSGALRPLALAASYGLTVWHATFLAILLAGLSLTILPRFLTALAARTGMGGSLFGAAFALPQPFCSCCAAVMSPSLARKGASNHFLLAFVVGSPMLNLTALILAALLLPAPYAITRIAAGVFLSVPVTYAVAWLAGRWWKPSEAPPSGRFTRWSSRWLRAYCRIFHVDQLVKERPVDTPTAFIASWLSVTLRVALLLVPTLFLFTMATGAIIQVLPEAFGNNAPSVAAAAAAGTLLMISTWTEIPVAQQMIQAGFSGPAATLLVVLPPVSLPCLLLLGGALARFRLVALLGATVMAVGAIAGLAFL